MDTITRTIDDVLAHFDGVEEERDGWVALCPAHADSHPSLRITVGENGAALLKCRTGCSTTDVLRAAGLTFTALDNIDPDSVPLKARSGSAPASPTSRGLAEGRAWGAAAALADLADDHPARVLLRQRFRLDPADAEEARAMGVGYDGERLVVVARTPDGRFAFAQGRAVDPADPLRWKGDANPDGERWDAAGFVGPRRPDAPVVVCEGLSDALTVAALGRYDVVAVRGSGQAHRVAEIADALKGRVVYVAGDGDDAGKEFSRNVAAALDADVRIVPVPDGRDLGDVAAEGPGFAERLVALLDAAETPAADDGIAWEARWGDVLSSVRFARLGVAYLRATGHDVKHSKGEGFYFYDDGIWHKDGETKVRAVLQTIGDRIREAAATVFARAMAEPDEERQKALQAQANKMTAAARRAESTGTLNAALEEMTALPGVAADPEDFDANRDLLPVANGIVNLRTGEIRPLRREDFVTYRLPTAYDPAAQAPTWERFLREVLIDKDGNTDEELVEFAQRLVGYGITGETREQILALCWGVGANGKSVFLDVVENVFRPVSRTTDFETFASTRQRGGGAPTPELADLKGARLVFAGESDAHTRLAEGRVKRMTGDARISARALHAAPFSFTPEFLIVLATNYKPTITGTDEGIWRRLRLLPFRRYFAAHERDKTLTERIVRDEAAGVLAWAVRGAVAWYAGGLPIPETVEEETREYRAEEDRLSEFLATRVAFEAGRAEPLTSLWRAYNAWCEDVSEKHPVGRKQFAAGLESRAGVTKRRNSQNVTTFYGVRLLNDGEAQALARKTAKPFALLAGEGDGPSVASVT